MNYIDFISNFWGSSQFNYLYYIFGCVASLIVLDGVFRFMLSFLSGLFTGGKRGHW